MQMQRRRKVLHLPPMKPSLRHTVAQFSSFVHIPTNRSLSFSHSLACTAISISSSTTCTYRHSRARVRDQYIYVYHKELYYIIIQVPCIYISDTYIYRSTTVSITEELYRLQTRYICLLLHSTKQGHQGNSILCTCTESILN